ELTDSAAARDPGLSWFFNYVRGFIFIVLGRNEDAFEVLKTTEFADSPLQLAIAYMRLGRHADARAAVENGGISEVQSLPPRLDRRSRR
ncbi:hypothetical protein ACC685_36270, partial [Rhizobium ruizarguesonis]